MALGLSYNQTGATPNIAKNLNFSNLKPIAGVNLTLPNTNPLLNSGLNQGNNPITYQLGNNLGLFSHPTAPTNSTVTSHTTTTNPDGSTTTKQTYADNSNKVNSSSSSPTSQAIYDIKTGQLTDYGKSIGATPMSGGKPVTSTPTGTPPINSFPGIVSSLSNQGGTPNNQNIQTATSGLLGTAATNPGTSGQAYQDYQQAVNDLNTLQSNIAKQQGGIESETIPVEFQQGREQAIARQSAALIDAAQQKVNEKLAALNAQISGVQTQQAGYNQAGGLGVSGQNLAQGALTNAGQLASPVGANVYGFYNPASGTYSPYGNSGNGAFGAGNVSGQFDAGKTYTNMNYANNAAKGVKNTIDNFIQSNPSLNTSKLTAGNALQQWLQGKQLGDPTVQTFLNDVSEYVQTLAPVLGVGGTPTDAKAYTAQQFVNAQASGEDVQTVLNNIEALAQNKLSSFASTGGSSNPQFIPQTSGSQTGGTIQTSYGNINPNL